MDGTLNVLVMLCLPLLLKLYNLSGQSLELARLLVLIHGCCALVLWPASFTLPNALRAANDVRFTMVVSRFASGAWKKKYKT